MRIDELFSRRQAHSDNNTRKPLPQLRLGFVGRSRISLPERCESGVVSTCFLMITLSPPGIYWWLSGGVSNGAVLSDFT